MSIILYRGTMCVITLINNKTFILSIKNGEDLKNKILKYKDTIKKINIPPSVTSIVENSFNNCDNLEEIIFSNCLINIEEEAFESCIKLEELNFPSSLISIGNSAFDCCINLKKVFFPPFLTTIEDYAFIGCDNFNKIILPPLLENLGYLVFNNNNNDITFPITVIKIELFYNISPYDGDIHEIVFTINSKKLYMELKNINIIINIPKSTIVINNNEFININYY